MDVLETGNKSFFLSLCHFIQTACLDPVSEIILNFKLPMFSHHGIPDQSEDYVKYLIKELKKIRLNAGSLNYLFNFLVIL